MCSYVFCILATFVFNNLVSGLGPLEPFAGRTGVRKRALPKAGRETVKRFPVRKTLDK
eukprot:COSAG02_NODE_33677_length_496_cov_1.229219_1_plen_57_part_10